MNRNKREYLIIRACARTPMRSQDLAAQLGEHIVTVRACIRDLSRNGFLKAVVKINKFAREPYYRSVFK